MEHNLDEAEVEVYSSFNLVKESSLGLHIRIWWSSAAEANMVILGFHATQFTQAELIKMYLHGQKAFQ